MIWKDIFLIFLSSYFYSVMDYVTFPVSLFPGVKVSVKFKYLEPNNPLRSLKSTNNIEKH